MFSTLVVFFLEKNTHERNQNRNQTWFSDWKWMWVNNPRLLGLACWVCAAITDFFLGPSFSLFTQTGFAASPYCKDLSCCCFLSRSLSLSVSHVLLINWLVSLQSVIPMTTMLPLKLGSLSGFWCSECLALLEDKNVQFSWSEEGGESLRIKGKKIKKSQTIILHSCRLHTRLSSGESAGFWVRSWKGTEKLRKSVGL